MNAKKHSLASVFVVSFKQIDKKIQINCVDNGVEMRLDEENVKNGLQNTESRIVAIDGKITFDSEPGKGFKVMFQFSE